MPTGKEMCDTIVKANLLVKSDGTAPTAEEIWNYSASGELAMVFLWYRTAKAVLENRQIPDSEIMAWGSAGV